MQAKKGYKQEQHFAAINGRPSTSAVCVNHAAISTRRSRAKSQILKTKNQKPNTDFHEVQSWQQIL